MVKQVRREYNNDYPSVTTVLGVLRKIGLEMWYKWNTAKFCDEESNKGKLIGTQIHEAIHAYIQNEEVKVQTEYSEEVMNALKGFMRFRKEHPEIKLRNSEMALTSEKHKFNGTLDCFGENGSPLILDWKTGKCKDKDKPDIYDEYKYQVAAYVNAYNEVNNANVEQAIILSLAKDKIAYNIYKMDKEELNAHFNDAFLPALKIWNHSKRRF
jgi:hypothetical protein